MGKKHYGAIDGLRAIACLGIVMMHIKTNNVYSIDGVVYQRVITSLTNFVFLFMEISAFGLCCGYFERMISGKLSFTKAINEDAAVLRCVDSTGCGTVRDKAGGI